jgi:hypothetical protein
MYVSPTILKELGKVSELITKVFPNVPSKFPFLLFTYLVHFKYGVPGFNLKIFFFFSNIYPGSNSFVMCSSISSEL